jgi:hypothetical protein
MHRQRIMSMFVCCGGCHWPISAGEKLRWPIPVPLTVISAWWNQGGQWWEFAIISGWSHVGGIFWGYSRVIYHSTYVGIVLRSLIFETSIFLMSTSKIRETTISMSVRHLIFHHEDSIHDPQTLVQLESWDSQLSLCVFILGGHTDYFVNKKASKWGLCVEVLFLTESSKNW